MDERNRLYAGEKKKTENVVISKQFTLWIQDSEQQVVINKEKKTSKVQISSVRSLGEWNCRGRGS